RAEASLQALGASSEIEREGVCRALSGWARSLPEAFRARCLCRLQLQRFAVCCTTPPIHFIVPWAINWRAEPVTARGSGGSCKFHKEEGYATQAVVCVCDSVRAILLGVTTAVAQVNTATLTGLVTDPQ